MYMNTFSLKVIATDKTFYDGKAEVVILPASDGERAILAHHENMVIALVIGDLSIKLPDGTWLKAVVGTGFAQVFNNRVTILVDTAESPEEIDTKRAQEALERAQEQLRQQQSEIEYQHTQAALARAMRRLKSAGKGL